MKRRNMKCEDDWVKEMKKMRDQSDKYNDDEFWNPKPKYDRGYYPHNNSVVINQKSSGRLYSDNYEDGKLGVERGYLRLEQEKFKSTPEYHKRQVFNARFVGSRMDTFFYKFKKFLFSKLGIGLILGLPLILVFLASMDTKSHMPTEFFITGYFCMVAFMIVISGMFCFASAHFDTLRRI